MNCPFQRAFILLDYVYVIRKSQVVYSYSVYRYSFFAIFFAPCYAVIDW